MTLAFPGIFRLLISFTSESDKFSLPSVGVSARASAYDEASLKLTSLCISPSSPTGRLEESKENNGPLLTQLGWLGKGVDSDLHNNIWGVIEA